MRIVFFGTPEFAVASLDALFQAGYEIAGVVTSVDGIGGRGRSRIIESAVKKYALSKGLKILQPKSLKSKNFLSELSSLKGDLFIIVAFRMLPEVVWDMPRYGTYNLHGSLLPKYRGAAPINWAIIRGEKTTGVTSFRLNKDIDTGDIAFQAKINIGENENAGSLHDKLMILRNTIILYKQIDSEATPAPKLFLENCRINWNSESDEVLNFIRGLSPYPGAWTVLDGMVLKIFEVRKSDFVGRNEPGQIAFCGKNTIVVSCKDTFLELMTIQLEGKKRMDVASFVNGYQIKTMKMN